MRLGGMRTIGSFAAMILLAGCAAGGGDSRDVASATATPGAAGAVTASPGAPSVSAEAPPEGCFLTDAEVMDATGTSLYRPTEGSFGPKGDGSCLYYLAPEQSGGFGCHCLGTNGPFDLEGQGTDWLKNTPGDGEMLSGVGDGAYYLAASRGDDLWAVKGQVGIHIGIDYQHLSAEQLSALANLALGRL